MVYYISAGQISLLQVQQEDLSDLKTALSKFICFLTTIVATAVTKSGTGTWDLGSGDSGTWGRGDVGTRGRQDAGTRGLGDVGTWGRGDSGTSGRGDSGTRGRGDVGTWGRGDSGTRGRGDMGTHFYHLFNFSSYFTKSS